MERQDIIIKLIEHLLDGNTPTPKESTGGKMLCVGSKVLIQTVSYHYIGTVSENDGDFLTLKDCGWLAESGRFSECLNNGSVSEFEKSSVNCCISIGSIVAAWPWKHDVPETQ
tara:strand:+ start:243 stop:581 length:339 start_codon:yes stop_codon:yes gene_type:complete